MKLRTRIDEVYRGLPLINVCVWSFRARLEQVRLKKMYVECTTKNFTERKRKRPSYWRD